MYTINVYDPGADVTIIRSGELKSELHILEFMNNYTDMVPRQKHEFYRTLRKDGIAEHKNTMRDGTHFDILVMIDDE